MKKLSRMILIFAVLSCFGLSVVFAVSFGTGEDVSYSKKIWNAMIKTHLVGSDSFHSTPYEGTHPHGAILDTIDAKITVMNHKGVVIVKKNFGGKNITKTLVADNPDKYLKAITVMYQRENGYDKDNKNWF